MPAPKYHLPEEHRAKLSEAKKRDLKTIEHCRQLAASQKGKPRKPHTAEACKKMSAAATGERNHNYGKHPSEETRLKLCELRAGEKHPFYGKKHTEESRQKMSESHIGIQKGEKHPMWKGGVSFEPYCVKFNDEFKERVRAFFGYRCVECGTPQNGKSLDVHHVNFNKKACCDGTVPLFVPLCPICHGKTQKDRSYWVRHFTEMITSKYDGRCYFTKEEMTE